VGCRCIVPLWQSCAKKLMWAVAAHALHPWPLSARDMHLTHTHRVLRLELPVRGSLLLPLWRVMPHGCWRCWRRRWRCRWSQAPERLVVCAVRRIRAPGGVGVCKIGVCRACPTDSGKHEESGAAGNVGCWSTPTCSRGCPQLCAVHAPLHAGH